MSSFPSTESELDYKPADTIVKPGPDTIIARSYEQFTQGVSNVQAPNPRWSGLIALVLLLLCFEASWAACRRFGSRRRGGSSQSALHPRKAVAVVALV